jgi:hypothetical protein
MRANVALAAGGGGLCGGRNYVVFGAGKAPFVPFSGPAMVALLRIIRVG